MAYTTTVELVGAELANHLANTLSDVEFELLVRQRIKLELSRAHERNPNLYESHDTVYFNYSSSDDSKWTVGLGETYSLCGETKGQVLSATVDDAESIMVRKKSNKLSLLLAPPAQAIAVE